MREENAIEITGLTKVYKVFQRPSDRVREVLSPFHRRYSTDFYALHDVSFSVRRGETLGIIGKNGAGKSTLLKIITGVLTPTVGRVDVRGRIASLLELGAGFNPEMTGIENIYLNGDIMGISKQEMAARVPKIIDFADIGSFIERPVKTYSSGMFARLAFAVNAFVEPEILIVDEALSVGDVFFQNKCFHKFEELRRSNVTILFVSHDISAVRKYCQRVLWLEEGRVCREGESQAVCDDYFQEELQQMNAVTEAGQAPAPHEEETAPAPRGEVPAPEASAAGVMFPPMDATKKRLWNRPDEGQFRSFFLAGEDGQPCTVLRTGRKYAAHFVVEFFQPLESVIFGLMMETVDGVDVLGFNSFVERPQGFSIPRAGVYHCVTEFTMPHLLTHPYLISPAVARGTQREHINIEWLPSYLRVQVENREGADIALFNPKVHSECFACDEASHG